MLGKAAGEALVWSARRGGVRGSHAILIPRREGNVRLWARFAVGLG